MTMKSVVAMMMIDVGIRGIMLIRPCTRTYMALVYGSGEERYRQGEHYEEKDEEKREEKRKGDKVKLIHPNIIY